MFPRGGRQTTRLGVAFWYFVISSMRMKLPARGALQIRAAASACCEAYLKNTVPIGLLAGYGDCPPTRRHRLPKHRLPPCRIPKR
jgi:hypothetical protein